MCLGILMKGLNSVYFGSKLDFFFELEGKVDGTHFLHVAFDSPQITDICLGFEVSNFG